MYNFKIAKEMAKSMAARFGVAYINYDNKYGYYTTSCFTHNTIGSVSKMGKFSIYNK